MIIGIMKHKQITMIMLMAIISSNTILVINIMVKMENHRPTWRATTWTSKIISLFASEFISVLAR